MRSECYTGSSQENRQGWWPLYAIHFVALIIGLICITDSMKAELPQTSYPGGNIHIFETLREGWQ